MTQYTDYQFGHSAETAPERRGDLPISEEYVARFGLVNRGVVSLTDAVGNLTIQPQEEIDQAPSQMYAEPAETPQHRPLDPQEAYQIHANDQKRAEEARMMAELARRQSEAS